MNTLCDATCMPSSLNHGSLYPKVAHKSLNVAQSCGPLAFLVAPPLLSKADPMVPWYGPLILNPCKSTIIPFNTASKTGAHSSEPFKEAKGPY